MPRSISQGPSFVSAGTVSQTDSAVSSRKYRGYNSASSSYASTRSRKKPPAISIIVYLKFIAVILTLLGGAILGIMVNLWRNGQKAHSRQGIMPEGMAEYDEHGPLLFGEIMNPDTNYCLDDQGGSLYARHCHTFFAISQIFAYTKAKQIRKDKYCAEPRSAGEGASIIQMHECSAKGANQQWIFTKDAILLHATSKTCVTLDVAMGAFLHQNLRLDTCSEDPKQIWMFQRLSKEDKMYNRAYVLKNISYSSPP